jgi:hypothetical protein
MKKLLINSCKTAAKAYYLDCSTLVKALGVDLK